MCNAVVCNWCKEPGKRFRNLPIAGTDKVAPWCQRCPDPRYKPRGNKEVTATPTPTGKDK